MAPNWLPSCTDNNAYFKGLCLVTSEKRDDVNAYRRARYAAHRKYNTPTYRHWLARQRRYEATHKTDKHVWWKKDNP